MARTREAPPGVAAIARRDALQRLLARLKRVVPFAAGVAATLLALYLYNALNPPAQPLTLKQVNTAVAKAMASATPASAYSARVYRAIQPSLVLIQAGEPDGNDADKPHGQRCRDI